MKAKRRYVAQNVFHARTLPGLGKARTTRLAAPGDAIPLHGVENKHTATSSLSLRGVRHANARGEQDAFDTRTQATLRRARACGRKR